MSGNHVVLITSRRFGSGLGVKTNTVIRRTGGVLKSGTPRGHSGYLRPPLSVQTASDACCCLQAGDATSSASHKSRRGDRRCQDADPISEPASVQVMT